MTKLTDKAVILARGVGSRMRAVNGTNGLTAEQKSAADEGAKGMMPVGRPFLDYVLHGLAEAGYRRVCLVVGPEEKRMRNYFTSIRPERLEISFAVQEEAKGTADAVAAAEGFVGTDFFLTVNSDNYYPVEACRALRELGEMGVAAFDRDTLVTEGNIAAQRLTKFAIVEESGNGYLAGVLEKPGEAYMATLKGAIGVSMNCWMFGPAIFGACRWIGVSTRGEYELTDAVNYLVKKTGEKIRVVRVKAGVLDLSCREDIAGVTARLAGVEVRL